MLSLGYNLHVIAKARMTSSFSWTGLADQTMPEAYVAKLAAQNGIFYNHLLATLEGKMKWRGVDVILTGLAPEVCPPGQQKQAMVFSVEPGTAYVGHRVATVLEVQKGGIIDVERQVAPAWSVSGRGRRPGRHADSMQSAGCSGDPGTARPDYGRSRPSIACALPRAIP